MKRLHVHVGVTDLSTSIGFYSTLFGAEPTVTKDDYAKWMLEDPRVNFAISSGNHAAKGIEHLGIQVENGEELTEITSKGMGGGGFPGDNGGGFRGGNGGGGFGGNSDFGGGAFGGEKSA